MTEIILGGFLWAPSIEYWNDILDIIDENYKIIRVKKYKFGSFEDLERVIIRLYENDKSAPLNKIKKIKIATLKEYEPVCLNFYFKVKSNGNVKKIPDVIEMKKMIRHKFRDNIRNYKRDIIIHISDNPKQTSFVDNLIDNYIRKKN